MHHAVMRIPVCISRRLSIIIPKNGVLGGVEGEDVKILCCNPQKALTCVNTRLLVYRVSKSVQRPTLKIRGKILRTKSGNFGYMGRSNPCAILTKICGLSRDMVDVITYALFGDCRLRGVSVVRGNFAFSH